MYETCKVPVCLSMKRYRRRKIYQRLKRTALKNPNHHEDDENETISMLEKFYRTGTSSSTSKAKSKVMVPKVAPKVPSLPMVPLRKWRDAYVELMLCFAAHVKQLNNINGNVYSFKRFSNPRSRCLEDN